MKNIISLIIVLFATSQYISSQVVTTFFSDNKALSKMKYLKSGATTQKVKIFPAVNTVQLLAEDEELEGKDVPFRFGKGFDTNITLADGEWIYIDTGRLWMMKFKSLNAFSLNFIFNELYLPEGAELYIVNTEGSMLYGPVTSKENINEGTFLTDLIKGDEVTIYLFEPTGKENLSRLEICRVIHAYKNLFFNNETLSIGEASSCNADIACYSQYQQEADGVCMILLSNGDSWCSGALVTTTDYSFKPYILSAFHCIDYPTEDRNLSSGEISAAENWMFKFKYQKNSCSGSSITTSYTYNRANFRAAWRDTDFALMEMAQKPTIDVSWLGWDRSDNTPSSGFGIHHPKGDVKKISISNTSFELNSTSVIFGNPPSSFTMQPNMLWNVTYTIGTAEGGSSGSPLFDQNKRVVGQLVGGPGLPICPPVVRRYGRLNRSWTGGETNSTRLSNWLDPANTGVITTNLMKIPTISGSDAICNDDLVTYRLSPALPSTASIVWSVTGGHAFVQSGQGTSTVKIGSSSSFEQGNCTLTATLGGYLSVSKTIHVGADEVIRIDGPTNVKSNGYYTYTAYPILDIYSATADYQWSVTPNVFSQQVNRHENSINFVNSGYYTISCKFVNNISACGDQLIPATLQVYVSSFYLFSNVKGIITITQQQDQITAMNKVSNKLYTYEVYNQRSGLLITKSKILEANRMNIDLTSLPSGTYVLKLLVSDKQTETFKFVL